MSYNTDPTQEAFVDGLPLITSLAGLAVADNSRFILAVRPNPRTLGRPVSQFSSQMDVMVFSGKLRWDERANRYVAPTSGALNYRYVDQAMVVNFVPAVCDDHQVEVVWHQSGHIARLHLGHHFMIASDVVRRTLGTHRTPAMGRTHW